MAQIAEYGLIGDSHTCALVARSGAIEFLCWPRFDSDACFASMLGDERHGHWTIAPSAEPRAIRRRYRGDTLVLETEFETDSGVARLIDFMPERSTHSSLIRIVEGVRGEVAMRLALRLRFNYGDVPPWIREHEGYQLAEVGPDRVVLHGSQPVRREDDQLASTFTVRAGQQARFELCHTETFEHVPQAQDCAAALARTERTWLAWIGRFDRPCRWPGPVKRSLLTLKALTDARSGGLVAAATLGLPEVPGGSSNWDYRYCWLRDATFTLSALLNAGYHDEARAWREWILRAVAGRPDKMQIMYRVDGGRRIEEYVADWLPGYQGARPVLVGNRAATQSQIDVFGELLDSMHLAARAGIERDERSLEIERALVEILESRWDQPGSGIWEDRDEKRCYTYSQVMAWVGIDRFLRGRQSSSHAPDGMLRRLRALRGTIHETVCARGFDAGRGHFVAYHGASQLDASLLLLPLVGFLPADESRMAGTIAAIERELMQDGLVRRAPAPAHGPQEGAFLACSFWLADCYHMQGRAAEAHGMLERVMGVANDVGLLSEEYHVPSRTLIGNMPQALSHLGLVNTALLLSGPVLQRGG